MKKENRPASPKSNCTTGLPGLDRMLKGVLPGDNVVWQVERWEEYRDLVAPYADAACRAGLKLVYFRFASHPELLKSSDCQRVFHPNPRAGFERFVKDVHDVISDMGDAGDAVYVFDCLSELSDIWQADAQLGNFFMLTCPRLLEYQSLTYFALYRHAHSEYALGPIRETTQFMLDVFSHNRQTYIRPLKVQYRSADAMNLIHRREGDDFLPVNSSVDIAEILRSSDWRGFLAEPRQDPWHLLVLAARNLLRAEHQGREVPGHEKQDLFRRLLQELMGGEAQMFELAQRHLNLEELVAVCNRLIGGGRIGGKAAGMLIAQAILREREPDLHAKLEAQDSFYVGSDLYHTFLIRNRVWWIRERQKNTTTFLDEVKEARERILRGSFPDYAVEQFRNMLDYFGESPFIVRSSSLLEDAYGNAFAGKYESVFCVNQGPPDARLNALMDAVRVVYASTLGEEALLYRRRRGLLEMDEQMALLLMRVSGQQVGDYVYPHLAGVCLSYNPFVWHKEIDPAAGVMRLVFGLGTRAVDRADDDPTRLVALNAPELHPAREDQVQRKMDCLDLKRNQLGSGWVEDIIRDNDSLPMDLFTSRPPREKQRLLTFAPLFRDTDFVADFRKLLQCLETAYGVPVDIEFSANFTDERRYRINLLQCRPFQVRPEGGSAECTLTPSEHWIDATGPVIGAGRQFPVDRIILVEAEAYADLSEQKRHAVAKIIGRLNKLTPPGTRLVLIGPGRWGTSQPSLGVPVRFNDINQASAVYELAAMHEHLVPDVSLGTHFLNELIESHMLYTALRPDQNGNRIDLAPIRERANKLSHLLPDAAAYENVIRVIFPQNLWLRADVYAQRTEIFKV